MRPALCLIAPSPLALMLALAAPAHAADADAAAATPIEVIGHPDPEGLLPEQSAPAATASIGPAFIAKQAPNLNAFQLITILPGANVASTDPFGFSTSSSLALRGLGQDEIGVVMEGAPQNDIGYYFAYPAQFADPENLKSLSLSPGASDSEAPVVNGVGGLLNLTLSDPAAKPALAFDASAGSDNLARGFIRLDTGAIGHSGLAAFVSYSFGRVDNWRGPGFDKRQHVDAKLLKTWDNGSRASLSISYNDLRNTTYPSPTLAEWQTYGRSFSYDPSYAGGDTNYWRLYRQLFRNTYLSAPSHIVLGDHLSLDTTAYLQFGYGNSPYGTSLTTTGNYLGTQALAQPLVLPGAVDGSANVLGNFVGDQRRMGVISKLVWQAGAHRLSAGLWYDRGLDKVNEGFTSLDANGNPTDPWGYIANAIKTADGQFYAASWFRTQIIAKAAFIEDSWQLSPRLTIEAGFKGVSTLRHGANLLPGDQGAVRSTSFAALPRAAVRWQASDASQFFANITTHFRAPDEFTLYDSYYGGSVYAKAASNLANEYAIGEEAGWRWRVANLSASVTAFHYDFRNRQLSTLVNVEGALVTTTLNAGGQSSTGIDAEIDWRPAEGVSLYASGEWLHTRLKDNLPVAGDYLPTAGKQAPQSPEVQFALAGTYDRGALFGSFALKYLGRQYATFMNDEAISGYATLDLSIGAHLAGWLDGRRTDLRVNALNLTNPHALSGVSGITPNALDTTGTGGTLVAGSAPTYYIASGRAFAVTLARAF